MVSVIVPVYNVEPYLRECLDSIITQTHTNLEIIIIDDGSTDGSGAICDAYAAKDARIQVIHQENRGLSAARNRGIELAYGEYLHFVDSDDYLLPDCIEMLLKLCVDYDADMSIGTHTRLEHGKTVSHKANASLPEPELFVGPQKMEAYLRYRKLPATAWGKLYAAHLFRNIRYPEGKVYEDIAIFHHLLHAANRIVHTTKNAYVYRKRPGSITTSSFSIQDLDVLAARKDLLSFIAEANPSLLPHAQAALVATCSNLMRRIATSENRYPVFEQQLQAYCRKYCFSFLRYGYSFNSRAYVLLICISQNLARYAGRLYLKLSKH